MAVRNLKRINPIIYIPPQYTANFKITVEKDGVEENITDSLSAWKIQDGVTEAIGSFEFTIPNPNQTYTDKWTGMEIFRYYSDYSTTTPTTLRFRGRLEKPSNQDNSLKGSGRTESLFMLERTVTREYSDEDIGTILLDIFNAYDNADRFDKSQIAQIGQTLTVQWVEKPFWDCVKDLCTASGYDCYIDCNLVVKFYESGTVSNDFEGIIHDNNLLEVGEFAPDITLVRNKVRVYGATVDGVQVFYTANDFDSQEQYGIRVENIFDDSIQTIEAAQELAEFTLDLKRNPPSIGDVKGVLLASIQPGEKIWISSPMENLPPAKYLTVNYVHEMSDEGLTTTVSIDKEVRTISHILKNNIEQQNSAQQTSLNSNDLDFAYTELFNSDSGTHSNTQIGDGVLSLVGAAPGTWTAPVVTTSDGRNVDQVNIIITGDNIPGVGLEISTDNGFTYEAISVRTLTTISQSLGTTIIVRITLNDDTSQVDSLSIQYSTKAN